jgi:hypothetical protein
MLNTDKLERLYRKREEISYKLIEVNKPDKVAVLEDKLEQVEEEIGQLEGENEYVVDFWKKYAED